MHPGTTEAREGTAWSSAMYVDGLEVVEGWLSTIADLTKLTLRVAVKRQEGRKACVCACPPFFSVAAGALNVRRGHVSK